MKRTLLVWGTLGTVATLTALMAYVVVDALKGASTMETLGTLGFPVGLGLGYWSFSSKGAARFPPALGVLAVVLGIASARSGPSLAVPFGSLLTGFLFYALSWMVRRLPATLRGQRPGEEMPKHQNLD